MLSPRWRKVFRDLLSSKTRTALVVLSIAVGVFAVGTIASSRAILARDLGDGYNAINPSSAVIYTEGFDDDLVQTVRNMPGVAIAEGRRNINVRLQVGPDEWEDLQLFAINDFDDIQIDIVRPENGAWPPDEREVLIERSAVDMTRSQIGSTLQVQTGDDKLRELTVVGTAHDLNQFPSPLSGTAYGYISYDTLEWLGGPRDYNELRFVVADDPMNYDHVRAIAAEVKSKVEKSGREVFFTYLPTPGEHPSEAVLDPMLLILGVLGVLSLFLSGFLVVNTISALLTQQIRQIGVMKSIGARNNQIIVMYLVMVLIFGLLALLVAVPLGIVGASAFTGFMAGLINFDITSVTPPLSVMLLQVAVALLVPLLAALIPIINGARITVHQAISGYGLEGGIKRTFFDRLLEQVRIISRPMRLSLRNTFRRKGRLVLTLSTLTLGGAIFIAVLSVRDSLLLTLDDALEYFGEDVQINFDRPYRIEQITDAALRVPGVVAAESWGFYSTRRVRPDETESDTLFFIAPPAETEMINPSIIAGRWLLPDDQNAVVINTEVTRNEEDLQVGDTITLTVDGRELEWQIVGLVRGVLTGPIVYANYPYFAEQVRNVGRGSSVRVITARHDPVFQDLVATALEERYESQGLRVNSTQTTAALRQQIEFQFNIIIVLLLIMALLLAVVGGLGLMGTMSINVIERTREIGVLRAIGASDGAVLRIVMVEGVLIGIMSWVLGALIALPLSQFMSNAVGMAFLQIPLSYTFSITGALLWLGVVMFLAALASFLPAWNASRLTVRDVLAYE